MLKKSLLYIGNKLASKGNNITTIETLGLLLTSEGYRLEYASEKQNQLLRLLDMLWKTFSLRKSIDYVLIDTYSTSGFWFAFLVSQLCRLLKKKYIPILHGGNLPVRLQKNPKLSEMIFAHSYKNIAPSLFLQQAFEKAGYQNIVFLPNVLEIEKYSFKERKLLKPNILWVRAFSEIYNPKMAVAVFQKVKADYPEATLCMVGPNKDGSKEDVEHYAKTLGLEVRFTGRLEKEEWVRLSTDYDIFINTTHLDNTPVSVMEAMALGIPVVSTNVGGLPFLIANNEDGILVDDSNVQEMANAVRKLLSDEQLANKISLSGRRKAQTWDWMVVKHDWNALLQ